MILIDSTFEEKFCDNTYTPANVSSIFHNWWEPKLSENGCLARSQIIEHYTDIVIGFQTDLSPREDALVSLCGFRMCASAEHFKFGMLQLSCVSLSS